MSLTVLERANKIKPNSHDIWNKISLISFLIRGGGGVMEGAPGVSARDFWNKILLISYLLGGGGWTMDDQG